jgi:hypothetical protein
MGCATKAMHAKVSVGMQILFRVRGRCDGSEKPRAYSSVYLILNYVCGLNERRGSSCRLRRCRTNNIQKAYSLFSALTHRAFSRSSRFSAL